MKQASRGIIYVATGLPHIQEAVRSAQTLACQMPDVPRILFADILENIPKDLFQEVRILHDVQHSFLDKIAPLGESPFKFTIFLDTDTHVCLPFYDVFEILEQYELAAAHAVMRLDGPFPTPNVFAELNTGVIGYRLTPRVKQVFARWRELFSSGVQTTNQRDSDQPGFRQAVWETGSSLYILPPEYNFRTTMPAATGRVRVRILHGRSKNMYRLEARVNASRHVRLFLPSWREWDQNHFQILENPGFYFFKAVSVLVRSIKAMERFLEPIKRKFSQSK